MKDADEPFCAYCRSNVNNTGQPLTYDHIVPLIQGGTSDFENICRACRQCNEFKGDTTVGNDPSGGQTVPLFHPRQQRWADHFAWDVSGIYIVGRTSIGRATIIVLNMNNPAILFARRRWVSVGWHPPQFE